MCSNIPYNKNVNIHGTIKTTVKTAWVFQVIPENLQKKSNEDELSLDLLYLLSKKIENNIIQYISRDRINILVWIYVCGYETRRETKD